MPAGRDARRRARALLVKVAVSKFQNGRGRLAVPRSTRAQPDAWASCPSLSALADRNSCPGMVVMTNSRRPWSWLKANTTFNHEFASTLEHRRVPAHVNARMPVPLDSTRNRWCEPTALPQPCHSDTQFLLKGTFLKDVHILFRSLFSTCMFSTCM